MAVGDFNADGKHDLAGAGYDQVLVLLGNADGRFQGPLGYSTGGRSHGVAVADFNGDGRQDLAEANYRSDRQAGETSSAPGDVGVLLGNGDGTFGPLDVYAPPEIHPNSVVAGDFDGDGNQDLAAGNGDAADFILLRGNGDGSFQTAVHHDQWGGLDPLLAGDFDRDGRQDLVTRGGGLRVLLGNADGTFRPSYAPRKIRVDRW